MRGTPRGWMQPSDGSVLARLRERQARHPDEFECAVRVVSGEVPGECARWRYRRSAVDPLELVFGEVDLTHGDTRLRLRFTGKPARAAGPGATAVRAHHVVWPAEELRTGAQVEVAADLGEAVRLRVPFD